MHGQQVMNGMGMAIGLAVVVTLTGGATVVGVGVGVGVMGWTGSGQQGLVGFQGDCC